MDNKDMTVRNRAIAGIALIILGLLALVPQFFDAAWMGLLILPALSLDFFAWGIITRESGLIIPGGILAGIGLGTILIAGPFTNLTDENGAALFMLSFAFGWILIPIVSILFTRDKHLWALFPAAIFALVGAGLYFGGAALEALAFAGRIWPVFLILVGLWILYRRNQIEEKPTEKFSG